MKIFVLIDARNGNVDVEDVKFETEKGIKTAFPDAETEFAIADGRNENKTDFIAKSLGGKILGGKVYDGNFFVKNASYGVCDDTAIISVADSSGLKDVMIKDPGYATSYGLGQQISSAFKVGKTKINVFLDGGASNDCGTGAAAALGAKFYDEENNEFVPTGASLGKVKKIDLSGLDERINKTEFVAFSDENVELTGQNGCAFTTAKNKGAKKEKMQIELEENMKEYLKNDIFDELDLNEKGLGNGGGLGLFVKTVLKGDLISTERWAKTKAEDFIEKKTKETDLILCLTTNSMSEKQSLFDLIKNEYKEKSFSSGKLFCEINMDNRAETSESLSKIITENLRKNISIDFLDNTVNSE